MTTDHLAQLIDAKLHVLVQLLMLARRQLVVIGENDLTTLLTVLAGKQQLVSQLQGLDRQLAPFQSQSPESRQWPSMAARQRCQQQAARCEAQLKEILVVEQQAERQITARRDETAQRLAAVNQSSHAQRTYAALPVPSASTLDLSSEG